MGGAIEGACLFLCAVFGAHACVDVVGVCLLLLLLCAEEEGVGYIS